MLESQIQIRPTTGQQNWMRRGTNTFFDEKLTLAAREVQFMWTDYQVLATIDIKKHIQAYLNGRNPESFEDAEEDAVGFANRFPIYHVCPKYLAAHFCGSAFPENGLAFHQELDDVGKTLVDW